MSGDEHIFTELIRDYVAECLPHAEQVTDTFVELERCWSEGIPSGRPAPRSQGNPAHAEGQLGDDGLHAAPGARPRARGSVRQVHERSGLAYPEAADLLVEGGSLLIDLIRHAAATPPAPEATADFVARVGRLLEAPAAAEPDRLETDRREGDRRRTDDAARQVREMREAPSASTFACSTRCSRSSANP